jgi:hypothetical protein
MNEETGTRILVLLDLVATEVAATRIELAANSSDICGLQTEVAATRSDVRALDAKVTSGFERVERRLGHLETRVEDVETEARLFRTEFERRVFGDALRSRPTRDRFEAIRTPNRPLQR